MTPLRLRMIEDLKIRNYSPRTIEAYIQQVAAFAKFFHKSPEFLEPPHIRQYQVHLIEERHASWAIFNQTVCALRFLYRTTLQKDWDIKHLPFAKKPKKLPVILSVQEVGGVIAGVENLKYRTAHETMYGAGLRVSESVNLKITDIDSQRMMLRIEQGKGLKDRYVPLSPTLLGKLREYWKNYRPPLWLFPGQPIHKPMSVTNAQKAIALARKKVGILKPVTCHTLRHCFATHLLEAGVNLRTIQLLLGHRSLNTTAIYLHVATQALQLNGLSTDLLQVIEKSRQDR